MEIKGMKKDFSADGVGKQDILKKYKQEVM